MTSIKQLTRLIQLAQDEWPKSQWEEMGILKAGEELRAINAALLEGEHIAKMCGALRDERDAARSNVKILLRQAELGRGISCPPFLPVNGKIPAPCSKGATCKECWDKWEITIQEDS